MRIVFHGDNGAAFADGFAAGLDAPHDIATLSGKLTGPGEAECFAAAEVIIGPAFRAGMPVPAGLRLFHAAGAGTDSIDLALLPPSAWVCNCFGHEHAIAEYVMAALLLRHVNLPDADARLRRGEWAYWASSGATVHDEMQGRTIGLLGFGRIGQEVAKRARAFGLVVHAANRGPIDTALVDRAFGLDALHDFLGSADFIVASLPLAPGTEGLVNAAAFAAMRPHAVLVNVGRGPVVDEAALYDALRQRRIGGAVIDTWYQYPPAPDALVLPSRLPFHELDNIVMTPHMSGWSRGTIRRRQQAMADNINRLAAGRPLLNVVRAGA